MRKRAAIRRSIPRGEPDRIADQLEAAANLIESQECQLIFWQADSAAAWDACEERRLAQAQLEHQLAAARAWYDSEYLAEEGHDQVYPWDHS